MLAYKISSDEVMEALSSQSLEASPGKTGEASGKRSQAFEYVLNIQVVSLLRSSMETYILRSSADGEILRLKDVANVA
jgi:HAE1 family hydrophobic/amphiphilic exporter-1